MARYRYAGTDPQPDPEGGIASPGDVREFEGEPAWGPWELLPDEADGGAVSDSAAPATQPPAEPPVSPAAASAAASAGGSAAAPLAPFGTETDPEGK